MAQKLRHAAVDSYRKAVEIEPRSAEIREALAVAYESVGKRKAAEKERAAIDGMK